MRIRHATAADLPAISAIYNATIATTTAAWTETDETLGEREAWFTAQRATLVADDRGTVSGFTASARALGKTQMIAAVDADDAASLSLHARLGFAEVARMPAVGYEFRRWLDLVLVQRPTAAEGAG